MGCSSSKLDDEEAVKLCKDRKKFIKQAVEQWMRFASGHLAYIHAMERVSAALRDYVEVDEPREFSLDSFKTPPFTTPIKKVSPGFISIEPNTFSITPLKSESKPKHKHKSTIHVNYLRSGGNPAVSVEERPRSPETVRIQAYSPVHQYGMDSFFSMQSSPMNSSSFFHYSPNNRPNLPPPSPQTSQWDFFWNPFSSLDYYGYPPMRNSIEQTILDDDNDGLRQVREQEGIPELEEETEVEETDHGEDVKEERTKVAHNFCDKDEVVVEDVDDDDDDEDSDEDETDDEHENVPHIHDLLSKTNNQTTTVAKTQNVGQVSNKETAVADPEAKEETPGFTVYVNRRPTSMSEVIKDLESQFKIACSSAKEVSAVLEAVRAQYSLQSTDQSAMKMLNPVALFRSGSSRSSSSRYLINPSTLRDEGYQSSSDLSDESSTFSSSHQSTLDRLYAWEKKLYEEVRAGERIRLAYEKKLTQLRNLDVSGADPSSVDKTRAAIRNLDTQIKVSIHSVESISRRIETLRDEELQPQLLELVQGLGKMWKVMTECHRMQKHTLDEAKLLLAGTPSKKSGLRKYTVMSPSETHNLARSAANLEMELRNWRACFESWIVSQRSYLHALAGWLLRCAHSDSDASKSPLSPRRSPGAPPIFSICIQWSRLLDYIRETKVLEGLDFFAAGVGSLYAQQLKEDSRRTPGGSKRHGEESVGNMEVVEVGQFDEEIMTAEKMAEVAIRVLCAGMSVALSSLTEFAIASADGYTDLLKNCENTKKPENLNQNAV
ncbi:nitrate regulatory gene2 protein-like [Lycium ferocissimum]|uniref:nitrate regulatory gene2 protein-like n=1 Tax=Lycium ferocissimum TaxID=112874 RepID=UPI0028156008|nr:nitrate regulatory gene2 protein-like [Lycium ferocissimum]XP_059282232.1 nitrate regulatory gene2 protein-like [Lycium ferocissimum]